MNDPDPPPVRTSEPVGLQPRRAGAIAALAGGIAALAGATVAPPSAPWWLPLLLFAVSAAVTWRILRPRPRSPRWEDEI